MKKFQVLVLLLVITFNIISSVYTGYTSKKELEVDYENPVKTSDQDEIKNLPGLNDAVDFRQFSGYLNADKDNKKFLHYWFVESQSNPSQDPLVLWLNGGPGCSSLLGLLTELGPFEVNKDGSSLKLREYTWNKKANVLFLESPYGVGFSYTRKPLSFHTDDTTASENLMALKSFMQKFPQYRNRPLYLTGESYAGVYLPTLAVLVDQDPEFNLKGVAIGNGYLDAGKLSDSLLFFAYYHGFIGRSSWNLVSKHCCDGKPPAKEDCVLSGPQSSWPCSLVVKKITAELLESGVNPYNIYSDCQYSSTTNSTNNKYRVAKEMMRMTREHAFARKFKPYHIFNASQHPVGEEPPCENDEIVVKYLNNPAVRNALHIPKGVGSWDVCATIVYIVRYPKQAGGLAPQMQHLIDSKRNLTLMVYNGDIDAMCNFLGDEWFVDDLGRRVTLDYRSWKAKGSRQIAGFVKHYQGVSYVTVRGSGHMVPQDRPAAAYTMFETFLDSKHGKLDL